MSTGSEDKRWDPAEHPRVPAGHGRASGRFMSTVDSILKLLGEQPEAFDANPSVISVQNPDVDLQPGIFRGFQRSGDWVEVGIGDLGTERGRVVAVGPTVVSLRQEPNAAWPQGMPIDVHYDAITSIRQAPRPQTPDRTRLYRPDLGSKPGPTFPSALGHDIMLRTRNDSMVRGTLVSTSDTSVTLQSWNGSHTQRFGQVVPYDQITEGWDLGWPPAHGAPEVGDTVTLYGISDARYRVLDINDVGTYRLQEIGSDNTVLAHPDNVTLAERHSGPAMDVLHAGQRVIDEQRRHHVTREDWLAGTPLPDETINADYFAAHNLLDQRVQIRLGTMEDSFVATVVGTTPKGVRLQPISGEMPVTFAPYDEIESVSLWPVPQRRVTPSAASELTTPDHDVLKKKPIKKGVLREKAEEGDFVPTFGTLSEEEQAVLVHAFEVSIDSGLSTRITSANRDGGEYHISGKVYDKFGNSIGTFNREINFSVHPPEMHNAYFSIYSEYQGQGLADAFYDQSESVLLDQGVEEITINADISVGGYAWARRGFDWADNSDAYYLASRMESWLRDNMDPGIHFVQGADEFIHRLKQGQVHPWELAAFGEDDPALHWTRTTSSGVEIDMWPGKAIMLGTSWNGVKPVGWAPPSTKGLAQTDYYREIAALYARADELFVPGDHLDGAPEDSDYNLHLADLLFTYSSVETKDAHFEELHPRDPHTGEFIHRGNLVPPLRDMLPLDIPLPEGYIPPTAEDRRRVRDATVVPGMAESIYERLEQMLDRALDDPSQTPEGMSIDDAYDEPPSPEEAIAKGDWVYFGACRDIRREADGLLGFTQESITTDPAVIYEPDPGWGGARTGANDPQRDALVLLYALKNTPRLEQPLFRGVTDPPQEMIDSLKRGSTFDLPLAAFTDGEAEATRFGSDLMFKIEGPTHAITGGMMGEGTFEYITGGRFKVVGIRHEKTWMGYTLQALKDRIAAMDEEGYDVTDYNDDYIDWMWKNDEFDHVFIERINQTEVRESIPRWGQATVVRIEQVGVFDPDTALLRKDVTGGVPRWRWSYLFDTALTQPKPKTRSEKKAFDRMAALKGELAAEMDAEINRLTDVLEEILSQQEETVIARLTGVKARKGTRHWDPVPLPTETKVLDVAYILLLAKWISMIRKAVRGSLGRTFNVAMVSVAKRAGTKPVRISPQEIAARLDPFTERLVDSMTARFHKIQEVIAISEGQGQDIGTISTNVRGAYKNKRRWAEMASEQATVGVYNTGSLIQADRSGEIAAKAWLSMRDDKVRPTHRHADGQVRALRDPFIVGGYPMMYPGDPTGPIRETANCRCTMLFRKVNVSGNAVPGPFRGLPLIPLPTDALGWPETIPAPWPSSKAFDPDQPRIPKGSEHAGRWVRIRPADAFANLWTRVLAAAGRPTRANPEGFKVGDSFDPFLAITKLQKLPVGARVEAGGKEWVRLSTGQWASGDLEREPVSSLSVTREARDAGTRVEIVALSEWDDWVGHVLDHDARSEEWSETIWALNNMPPGSVIMAVNHGGTEEEGRAHEAFYFTRLPNGDWETTSGDMVGPVLSTHNLIQRAQITQGHYVVTKVGDPKPSDYEIEEALRDEGNRRAAKRLVAQRIAERLTDVDPMELARVAGMLEMDVQWTAPDALEPDPQQRTRVRLDPHGRLIFATVEPDGGMYGHGPGIPNTALGNITDPDGTDLNDPVNWVPTGSPGADDLVRRAAVSQLINSWAQSSNDDNPLGLALQEAAAEEFKITGAMDWGYRKQWVITSSDGRTMKFNSPDDAKEFRWGEAFQTPVPAVQVGDVLTLMREGQKIQATVIGGEWVSNRGPIGPTFVTYEYEFEQQGILEDFTHVGPDNLFAINGKPVEWRMINPWSEPEELVTDTIDPTVRRRTEQIMDESGPVLRSFLRAQYDSTQDWLKEQGIDEIDLFRGMGKGPRTQRGDRAQGAGITPSRMRPMSSWTTSAREAQNFGNATYFTRVPREQVLGTPASGFGCLKETEIVILGHPMDVAFEAFQGTSARPEELPDLFDRKVVERGMQTFNSQTEAQDFLEEVQRVSPDLDVFLRQVAGMWEVYQLIKPVEVKGFNPRLHPRDQNGRFTDVPMPKVGLTFTHARHLDTDWKPGPGQRYVDAPHRVYRVSRVTSTQVYFTGLDDTGHFSVDRDRWGEAYGGPASTPDVALIQTRTPGEKAVPDTSGVKIVSSTKIANALVETKDFDPDQPRIPRGQPGGGRWLSVLGDLLAPLSPRHEEYRRGLKNPIRANASLLDDPTDEANLSKDVVKGLRAHVKEVFGVDYEAMVTNLDAVFKRADPQMRARGQRWYRKGHDQCQDIATRHDTSLRQAVGAAAALSPQQEWGANVALADFMAQAAHEDWTVDVDRLSVTRTKRMGKEKITKSLLDWARAEVEKTGATWPEHVDGTRLSEHSPIVAAALIKAMGQETGLSYVFDTDKGEKVRQVSYSCGLDGMTKAWLILHDGQQPGSVLRGHKVRSFYNNLLLPDDNPFDDVTIDTHAISAAAGVPIPATDKRIIQGFQTPQRAPLGLIGTYPVFADAYREIGERYGLPAHEVQAIIWLQWRKDHKVGGWMK